MELYILNEDLEILGVIDDYDSLSWPRKYTRSSNITLELIPNMEALNILQTDNIILKNDGTNEAGYIDHIELTKDKDGKTILRVEGKTLTGYTSDRLTLRNQTINSKVEGVMREYVDTNMINPTDENRKIANLYLADVETLRGEDISYNAHYKNLEDTLESIGETYGLGFRIRLDLDNRKMFFEVYEGVDRTSNQDINPRALFSPEFENLDTYTYETSTRDFRNMAIVAGAGEGEKRKIVTIGSEHKGSKRKEVFIDARDVSDTKTVGDSEVAIPSDEYNKLLESRGKVKLAEYEKADSFKAEVLNTDTLRYREDFDLGDLVTISSNDWGINLHTRIIEITENYSSDGLTIDIKFGNEVPNILKKIKRRIT